jgi:DNA-binding NtrC family response regulator
MPASKPCRLNFYEALEILDNRPDVGLLFTDIELPGDMDGLELSHLVHRERPSMIIVISSGQRLPTIETLPPGAMFLAKPVQAGQLDLVVEDARRRMAR